MNKTSFWNLEDGKFETIDPLKDFNFAQQTLLTKEENEFNHDKLYARILKYKDSKCFSFLNAFYDFYLLSANAQNEKIMGTHFSNANVSLNLFAYCWENEYKENL
jgi:hypothetical protein